MKFGDLKPGSIFEFYGRKCLKTAYKTDNDMWMCIVLETGKVTPVALSGANVETLSVKDNKNRLYNVTYRALETWEEEEQLRQAMEEAGEFIVECSKVIREGNKTDGNIKPYTDALERLREEAADMLIMVEQVKRITAKLDDKTFDDVLNEKIDKLEKEIEDVCTQAEQ